MLKEERQKIIVDTVNQLGIIRVSDLTEKLEATEMTLRRDLKYLEEQGFLVRIHGGARSKDNIKFEELSLNEKRNINIDRKIEVAKIAASLIKENDIVYIGPGTTNEYIYDYIKVSYAKIITNSLNILDKFKDDSRFEVILIGGKLRMKTSTLVGSFTNKALSKIRVKSAFIGTNGISEDNVMTSNEDEGVCQSIIMNNAIGRYVVCDSTKIEKEDFYTLYKLEDVTALVTDSKLDGNLKSKYSKYCKIIDKIEEE
ncbi:lactose phosphotransferase system repressor [Clostridium saccharobutylicum]|uniref:DeoR/GlpR family DNA-binding transcription regulator n=1 Tax=Clostridium saccharobutylicum TaxID=169679 RepID=UPI000983E776|nr:DeoR/GlpR family DNA-binding transcription regulator [Clostridium saccharobutylicum]AQS11861.1 lactose phosphotransferase system repressor [Clostridium saccharobutylicum]MBC2435561.1 DeoR/GlpR transcriptional regulator [Clostridium saccharobutylicum]NSB86964.1 DeoR family lactose phosphotransferase system repressor [Clostridium saccharobutylicum]NYC30132.1 DeoR family lactose phosphotransferase system repressor [Clostridium saccharobutylicum]OOM18796.1 lactose phosphotransferase system repr